MNEYAPTCESCDPVFYIGADVKEWRHSVTCEVAPGFAASIPHGHCPIHISEELFECRGCAEHYDLTHEDARDAIEGTAL